MADKSSAKSSTADSAKSGKGIFSRIFLFVRQVVGELRKVVYPTRNELWTYFLVVVVFVTIVMTYIGVIDFLFGMLSNWVFGGSIS